MFFLTIPRAHRHDWLPNVHTFTLFLGAFQKFLSFQSAADQHRHMHSKQFRFFKKNPSVLLPCNPRRILGLHGNRTEGSWQHFIDANYMEGVWSHTKMKEICSTRLHQILVGTNTTSFQSFWWQLFTFIRHQMNTQGKVIYTGLFFPQIVNTDFKIRYTSAKARFRVWLVFAIAITPRRSSTHFGLQQANKHVFHEKKRI